VLPASALLMDAVENAVERAGRGPVPDGPPLLESAVEMMKNLSALCVGMSFDERKMVVSRSLGLQARLSVMRRGLERSHAVISGYSHQAGVISQEYSPGGLTAQCREPALFMTQI
jgi:hypothetical protein